MEVQHQAVPSTEEVALQITARLTEVAVRYPHAILAAAAVLHLHVALAVVAVAAAQLPPVRSGEVAVALAAAVHSEAVRAAAVPIVAVPIVVVLLVEAADKTSRVRGS